MIERRPKSIERRSTLGHWEADTVVGKKKAQNKKVIFTAVDRKSGYLLASVLENSKAETLQGRVTASMKHLPKYKRKTMTCDNGREFAHHYDIERNTDMRVYFARPYSPWQR